MSYEPYVSPEYYRDTYQDGAFEEDAELARYLRQASRHIDSLTYNRIVGRGFSNLTAYQQDLIREVICQQAEFEFDQEWNGMAKVAEFRRLNLPDAACWPIKISNNKCMVPAEVLSGNKWYINVIGQSREGIRIPTGRVEVRQDG